MKMQVGPQVALVIGAALLLTACDSGQSNSAAGQEQASPLS